MSDPIAIDVCGVILDQTQAQVIDVIPNVAAGNRSTKKPYQDADRNTSEEVARGIGWNGWMHLLKAVVPVSRNRRDARPWFALAEDVSGNILAGINAMTGALSFKLDPNAETYILPETMRGGYDCFNVRPFGNRGIVATFQDGDGYTYDAMQLRGVVSNTAVAIERGTIDVHMMIGQSWAGPGDQVGGPVMKENLFPRHVLQIGNYALDYGDSDNAYYGLDRDLEPYNEKVATDFGASPMSLVLHAMTQADRDKGRRCLPRVGYTTWEGSQPLASFFPNASGHYNHENAIKALKRAKELSAPYVRPLRLASVVMIHGQNGPDPYTATFTDWVQNVLPLYPAAIGQSELPPFAFFQTNHALDVVPTDRVVFDQLASARSWASPARSLGGPTYQYPLRDTIHYNDYGKMMFADVCAYVLDYVVRQKVAWNPLWPVAGGLTRSGAVITIPLTLPPGALGLAFDDDWVQTVTNRGFKFLQTGGNCVSISSVSIVGNSIQITLSATPTGTSKKIQYAYDNNTGTANWSTGRGQVYATTDWQSLFHRRGYDVPPTVRHYLTRFEESVA